MNKKASLNMAIEVIVIIVIAMTLLGLGLGFVRSQFASITDIGGEVTEQVREQITGQLRTSGAKMSFPRTIQMARGERKVLTVGVQNTNPGTIYFGFNISLLPKPQSDHLEGDYDMRYSSDPCTFFLGPSEANAYGVSIEAPSGAGTDSVIVTVVQQDVEFCEKTSTTSNIEDYSKTTSFITVG